MALTIQVTNIINKKIVEYKIFILFVKKIN